VPRPRTPGQFPGPEFLATRRRLEEWIHPKNQKDEELPRLRLTRVGDEVE